MVASRRSTEPLAFNIGTVSGFVPPGCDFDAVVAQASALLRDVGQHQLPGGATYLDTVGRDFEALTQFAKSKYRDPDTLLHRCLR